MFRKFFAECLLPAFMGACAAEALVWVGATITEIFLSPYMPTLTFPIVLIWKAPLIGAGLGFIIGAAYQVFKPSQPLRPTSQLETLSDADKDEYETLCYTNDGVQVYVKMKAYPN